MCAIHKGIIGIMTKTSYNWLKRIQEGKGKKLARFFFSNFTNEETATAIFHPEAHKNNSIKKIKKIYKKVSYVDRNINRICREWEKEGFIEKTSIEIEVTNRWKGKNKQIVFLKILNLEPFYRYCKEKYNLEFSPEEKKFVNGLLNQNLQVRWAILILYPNDDIINATLKFYIKHFPLPFDALHGHSRIKFDKEYIELMERAEKDAEKVIKQFKENPKEKPQLGKEYGRELEKTEGLIKKSSDEKYDLEDLRKTEKILVKTILHGTAYIYMTTYKINPQLVLSVDTKFLKVLGIA